MPPSPYRLATESVSVTRQTDELIEFLSSQPPIASGGNLMPLPIDDVIVQLRAIRERTVALAEVGASSQSSRNGLAEVVTRLAAFNDAESGGLRPNEQLQILALTAASSESLIQLGELQREFTALSLTLAATQPDVVTTLQSRVFADRSIYLRGVLEIRTVLTAMREASGRLASATRQYAEVVDVNLREGLSDTNARLGRLETTILVSLVLVGLLSAAIVYYVVVRVSRAIAAFRHRWSASPRANEMLHCRASRVRKPNWCVWSTAFRRSRPASTARIGCGKPRPRPLASSAPPSAA